MTDSIRSFIMGKIRRAGRGASVAQVSSELQSLGPAPTPSLISESTSESFIANVLINKGTVECVSDRSAAVKAVADYLYQRFRSHKLVAGNDSRLAAMPWREAGVLPRFGSAENGDAAGLSYARLGIAETGSIVTWTGKSCPATNNLLVEDHIVIVELADLVTTMELAWERIHQHIGKQDKLACHPDRRSVGIFTGESPSIGRPVKPGTTLAQKNNQIIPDLPCSVESRGLVIGR